MARQIIAIARAILFTCAGSPGIASEIYLPRIISAKPLPPGVGLMIIIIHVTSCRAKIKKWSLITKNAIRMAFTTQYLDVQERNVAMIAFNQKENGCLLSSRELSTISSPAFMAPSLQRLRTGSLNKYIIVLFIFCGSIKRPYPTKITHARIIPYPTKATIVRLLRMAYPLPEAEVRRDREMVPRDAWVHLLR